MDKHGRRIRIAFAGLGKRWRNEESPARIRNDASVVLPEGEPGDGEDTVSSCLVVLGAEVVARGVRFQMASVAATCGAACLDDACDSGQAYFLVASVDGTTFVIIDGRADFSPNDLRLHELLVEVLIRYVGACRTALGNGRNRIEVDYLAVVAAGPELVDVDGDAYDIEGWYNPWRLHSSLGYLSPPEFERRFRKPA